MLMEGTEYAVTAGQAAELLPLWQALDGGVTATAEVDAILSQAEAVMTSGQLDALAQMQPAQDDLRSWAQDQGFIGNEGAAEREGSGGEAAAAAQGGPFEGTTEAERGAMRGEFESMSDEERAAMREEALASGEIPAGRGAGGAPRLSVAVVRRLVSLLARRAADTAGQTTAAVAPTAADAAANPRAS
jgi:hypothetical protein